MKSSLNNEKFPHRGICSFKTRARFYEKPHLTCCNSIRKYFRILLEFYNSSYNCAQNQAVVFLCLTRILNLESVSRCKFDRKCSDSVLIYGSSLKFVPSCLFGSAFFVAIHRLTFDDCVRYNNRVAAVQTHSHANLISRADWSEVMQAFPLCLPMRLHSLRLDSQGTHVELTVRCEFGGF